MDAGRSARRRARAMRRGAGPGALRPPPPAALLPFFFLLLLRAASHSHVKTQAKAQAKAKAAAITAVRRPATGAVQRARALVHAKQVGRLFEDAGRRSGLSSEQEGKAVIGASVVVHSAEEVTEAMVWGALGLHADAGVDEEAQADQEEEGDTHAGQGNGTGAIAQPPSTPRAPQAAQRIPPLQALPASNPPATATASTGPHAPAIRRKRAALRPGGAAARLLLRSAAARSVTAVKVAAARMPTLVPSSRCRCRAPTTPHRA